MNLSIVEINDDNNTNTENNVENEVHGKLYNYEYYVKII